MGPTGTGPTGTGPGERWSGEDDPSDVAPPPPPPPPASPASSAAFAPAPPGGPARGRRSRLLLVLALVTALAAGMLGGLWSADRLDVPDVLRSSEVLQSEAEGTLIALLEDIIRTEGVMLAFNDTVGERLSGVEGEDAALAVVAQAAAEGVGGLVALRPIIVERTGGPQVTDVRTIYLPHLDSWIDYLAALAADPALLASSTGQQPFILLINATADAFREALEDLLASGPSERAAALAERILDDGFRSSGPEPTV